MHSYLPLSFADDLEHNARWHGKLPAYVMDDRQITHAGLLARAKQLGSALYKAGARRQDRVGILSMNSLEYGEVIAATQWSGFILSTVNFRLAAPEMDFIINDSAPHILIFESQYLDLIAQLRPALRSVQKFVCVGSQTDWAESYDDFIAGGDPDGPPIRAREEDIACLIYTSGTTGRPKGCIWGHREFRQLAQLDNWLANMEQTERGLIVMPMFHIGGLLISLSLHFRGATVYLHRQFDAAEVVNAIARDRLSFLLLAPTMVQMVLNEPALADTDTSSVRTIMYSAAPMPLPVLRQAIDVFNCGFVNLYGQTEICMFCLSPTQHQPDGDDRERHRLTSVGNPYPNLQAKIVDDEGNECAPNVPGEIVARSSAMFRGYWNNHVATIETLREKLAGYGFTQEKPADVLWNFEKFLISRAGKVVARFAPDVTADDPALLAAIEKELA